MCNCICVCQTNSTLTLADDLNFDFSKELAEFSQSISSDIGSIESTSSNQFFDELISFDSGFGDFSEFSDLQLDFIESPSSSNLAHKPQPNYQSQQILAPAQTFDPVELIKEHYHCDC